MSILVWPVCTVSVSLSVVSQIVCYFYREVANETNMTRTRLARWLLWSSFNLIYMYVWSHLSATLPEVLFLLTAAYSVLSAWAQFTITVHFN